MNAAALSMTLISMLLALQSETRDEEPADTRNPLAEAAQTPIGSEPLDFKRPVIADGVYEPPSSGAFDAFGVGMFVVAGADLASTEVGLARLGVYESNPMQGHRTVRIMSHVAAPAFMYWVTDKLHDKGKRKLALGARVAFSVAYSYIVMHNLRTSFGPHP